VFVWRQLTLKDPLIDLKLFRVPAFSAALATYMMGGIIMFGSFVFIAQYLQLVLDLSPLEAGLWTMPFAGAFVVGSMVTPLFIRRIGPPYLMAVGMIVAALGFVMLSRVNPSLGLALLLPAFIVFSLGLAPVFTLATDMMIGTAPPERAGAASAISETCAEFGGALGIAVLGSIGTAIYRAEMANAIPAGVASESAETARSTLGGALSVAEQLANPAGVQILEAARNAFSQSLELAALISAALALVTAVVVAVVLRDARPGGNEDEAVDVSLELEPEAVVAG
jgi:DHA2 family multidrug resistance protein-like MFS transporter